jgi:hypothetical protein
MKDSYDLDFISRNRIEDGKGKSPNDTSLEGSKDCGILLRVCDNARQSIIATLHKLKIQIFTLVSVPVASFGEFVIGFGSEPN